MTNWLYCNREHVYQCVLWLAGSPTAFLCRSFMVSWRMDWGLPRGRRSASRTTARPSWSGEPDNQLPYLAPHLPPGCHTPPGHNPREENRNVLHNDTTSIALWGGEFTYPSCGKPRGSRIGLHSHMQWHWRNSPQLGAASSSKDSHKQVSKWAGVTHSCRILLSVVWGKPKSMSSSSSS